ncbi:MAG: hypothetical protein HN348_27235, partial [Proteobacteria bacterium]|nr:hypothetical protein [Pseudomonadota bacterium]
MGVKNKQKVQARSTSMAISQNDPLRDPLASGLQDPLSSLGEGSGTAQSDQDDAVQAQESEGSYAEVASSEGGFESAMEEPASEGGASEGGASEGGASE